MTPACFFLTSFTPCSLYYSHHALLQTICQVHFCCSQSPHLCCLIFFSYGYFSLFMKIIVQTLPPLRSFLALSILFTASHSSTCFPQLSEIINLFICLFIGYLPTQDKLSESRDIITESEVLSR